MNIRYTTGYAGTGKSHALIKLSEELPNAIVLAPTHKALDRLRPHIKNEIKTIHSMIGWIPGINENAENPDFVDYTIKLDKSIDSYTDIIIDEAGMMSEDMLMTLVQGLSEAYNYETDNVTLHLFLDPYQLLPVKGTQIQVDPNTETRLTTQHRAESKDLVKLFTKFVNFLEGTNEKDLTIPPSENVIYVDNLRKFQSNDRLLAFTNEAVGRHNEAIRRMMGIPGYEGTFVQLGNFTDAVYLEKKLQPDLGGLIEAYEFGRLRLQNSRINPKFLEHNLQAMIDNPDISFYLIDNFIVPVIEGIHKAHIVRRAAREEAVLDRKKFSVVYALERAFTMDYTFASTVHKAQGSEFDNVFIDKADIQKALAVGSYRNYARLMYVALSRAKKKAYIIDNLN